jgi:hypothetical protein
MRITIRKSHSITVHEQQMRAVDTLPNGHEQYFPFIHISRSFLIKNQKLSNSAFSNLVCSHLCTVNMVCPQSCFLKVVHSHSCTVNIICSCSISFNLACTLQNILHYHSCLYLMRMKEIYHSLKFTITLLL